ncbi:uncharacterized protein LOC130614099 isoform X2 [Hydractinia symbiolongicarpus]|uniref:uncharacterized protein LOC130614099 isoform X2 n=1 Tax=Hydractinia symbiolongicarpus TaxID=13093 RepID=UPI00254FD6AC|nr:uncharacterized protein LOC130614099 isoform X2 [Hydractinia symbiolongicarpus]
MHGMFKASSIECLQQILNDDKKKKRQKHCQSTDSGSEQDDQNGNIQAAIPEQPKKKPQGQIRAGLRSLYCDKPVRVKFVNHSGKEVQLYWINYVGECEKAFKILDGKCEVIDTYETHPWIAANARNKKVHHAFTIGNNLVYYPILGPNGGKYTVAEIRKAPEKLADLISKPNNIEVMIKFINRTSRPAFLEMINSEGDRELKYTLAAGQSWTVATQEKTYWITTMDRETDEGLLLNYGWYYSPVKTRMKKERCYITDYI